VVRAVEESLSSYRHTTERARAFLNESGVDIDISQTIKELEEEMVTAANNLEFEKAALLRDQVRELKRSLEGGEGATPGSEKPVSYRKGKSRKSGKSEVPF
jgi:excinuclease ABC subunit B